MRRNHIIPFFAAHTKSAHNAMSIWHCSSLHHISSPYVCLIYAQCLLLPTYIISQDVRTKSINLTGSHQTSCVQPWWDFLITNPHMNQDIVQTLYVESVSSAESVSTYDMTSSSSVVEFHRIHIQPKCTTNPDNIAMYLLFSHKSTAPFHQQPCLDSMGYMSAANTTSQQSAIWRNLTALIDKWYWWWRKTMLHLLPKWTRHPSHKTAG